MKSITIHNLDDPLDSLIREKAKKYDNHFDKITGLQLWRCLTEEKEHNFRGLE